MPATPLWVYHVQLTVIWSTAFIPRLGSGDRQRPVYQFVWESPSHAPVLKVLSYSVLLMSTWTYSVLLMSTWTYSVFAHVNMDPLSSSLLILSTPISGQGVR